MLAHARTSSTRSHSEGDPVLRAQLYFNLGLLEEKQGRIEAARGAFARSEHLHPTPAAAKKLGEGTGCPVQIDIPHLRMFRPGLTRSAPFGLRRKYGRTRERETFFALMGASRSPVGARCCCHTARKASVPSSSEMGNGAVLLLEVAIEASGGGFKCPQTGLEVTAVVDRGVLRVDSTELLCNTVCRSENSVDCYPESGGTRRSTSFWDVRARRPLVRVTWDDTERAGGSGGGVSVRDDGSLYFQDCELHGRVPLNEAAARRRSCRLSVLS